MRRAARCIAAMIGTKKIAFGWAPPLSPRWASVHVPIMVSIVATSAAKRADGKRGRFFQSPRTRTARKLPVSPRNDAMTLGAGVSLSAPRHKAMIFVTGNDIGVGRYFSVQG
jgi:hypothetical protein